ncbi:SRPBCC family protein [Rhodococcus sp. G-MC3]|uniref:SRPBCC family protein n=1 Tax=Rhodococcus sp. G-MC3 TaxID=3046209 RepID=UPI0024BA4862|nr:SRPBCC family protein [Rhodococcus sp. G-MC3]MDJ0395256.1 SRPBCC family protein [Rhodococcus sp. G-MC3]
MALIEHTAVSDCTRTHAFGYVDDYRTIPKWMFGVRSFEPVGDVSHGLGATFAAAMQIGPKTLRSTLRVTEWIENESLTLSSIDGISTTSTWAFSDTDDGGTRLDVKFAYSLPGGLAGRALGALVEPVVGQAIRQTESTLRKQLEA